MLGSTPQLLAVKNKKLCSSPLLGYKSRKTETMSLRLRTFRKTSLFFERVKLFLPFFSWPFNYLENVSAFSKRCPFGNIFSHLRRLTWSMLDVLSFVFPERLSTAHLVIFLYVAVLFSITAHWKVLFQAIIFSTINAELFLGYCSRSQYSFLWLVLMAARISRFPDTQPIIYCLSGNAIFPCQLQ